jgi:hypothetical protein
LAGPAIVSTTGCGVTAGNEMAGYSSISFLLSGGLLSLLSIIIESLLLGITIEGVDALLSSLSLSTIF